jgi:hypothetical protein
MFLIVLLIVLLAAAAIWILVLLAGALTASALLATLVLATLPALLASLILILILRHYISLLLAAQVKQALPAEGVAVHHEGVRFRHGPPHAAAVSASVFCKPCRKSAARWACEAAVKIARLSLRKTLIHDPI